MAANAAFTAVTVVGESLLIDGGKVAWGTAVGPDVAGADTVIDLSSAFNGAVAMCNIVAESTAMYVCQYLRAASGAPATGKVRILAGTTDVAQSTADLKGITFTWMAIGTD